MLVGPGLIDSDSLTASDLLYESGFGRRVQGASNASAVARPATEVPHTGVARALFDAVPDMACAVRADGKIIMVNAAWRAACLARGGTAERCGEGGLPRAVARRTDPGDPRCWR